MKLRLHSNSVRLRLSRPEVARLSESGRIEENVQFAPDQALRYAVECADTTEPATTFEKNFIRVTLPRAEVKRWIETDRTGIELTQGALRVLVEKDFKCIHRDSPDDSDSFPNPLA